MDAFYGRTIFIVSDDVIDHMNAADYEYVTFSLNFTSNLSRQVLVAGIYLARLQRTPEGADESTSGRGHNVINRCRVGLVHLFRRDSVVLGNCAVNSKMNRLRLRREICQPRGSGNAIDMDLRDVYNFRHTFHPLYGSSSRILTTLTSKVFRSGPTLFRSASN